MHSTGEPRPNASKILNALSQRAQYFSTHLSSNPVYNNRNFRAKCAKQLRSLLHRLSEGGFPGSDKDISQLIEHATIQLHQVDRLARLPSAKAPGDKGYPCPRIFLLADDCMRFVDFQFSSHEFLAYLRAAHACPVLGCLELSMTTVAAQLSALLNFSHLCEQSLAICDTEHAIQVVLGTAEAASPPENESITVQLLSYEPLLQLDPAGIYSRLDSYSKGLYRTAVERLSIACKCDPERICQSVLQLSIQPERRTAVDLEGTQSHIGYYLLDSGVTDLRKLLGVSPPAHYGRRPQSVLSLFVAIHTLFSLALVSVVMPLFCKGFHLSWTYLLITASLFVLLSRLALAAMLSIASALVTPSPLPRIDLASGIPPESSVVIAVPCLLLSLHHVKKLIERIKMHCDQAADPNVWIALLTDFPDSHTQQYGVESECEALELCSTLIRNLNEASEDPALGRFILLHRDRTWCKTQRCWSGWERKRGKVHALISYMTSGLNTFSHSVGNLERLRSARYILLLDDDVVMTNDTIQQLVGVFMHPLNRARVDQQTRTLIRGYAILQPTLVARHPLGPAPTLRDSESRRDLHQDLFGEAMFYGKGLIDSHAYSVLLDGVIPEGQILSHDIVESGFARTGAATRGILVESTPSNYFTWCKRQHRWIRGDWQNGVWLLPRLRGQSRQLSPFTQFRIWQNIMNSMMPISLFLIFVTCATRNAIGALWITMAFFLIDLTPCFIPRRRGPDSFRLYWADVVFASRVFLFKLCNLAHYALFSLDAIVRTCGRLILGRHLLEWEASASSEIAANNTGVVLLYDVISAVSSAFAVCLLLRSSKLNLGLIALLLIWTNAAFLRELKWLNLWKHLLRSAPQIAL